MLCIIALRGDYMKKYQYFNGLKFTRDDKTGYYLNSTIRTRMHRYVWEYHKGSIPKGYQIHHKDHDKGNNDISNLRLITPGKHATMHGFIRADTNYDEMVQNLQKNARPKAIEWHKSEEGRKWHKIHYQQIKDKINVERDFLCEYCGNKFASNQVKSRFCSNKCKSAHRRDSGVDNETRLCKICGEEFIVNKYTKTATCSKSCASKLAHKGRGRQGG